LKKKNEEYESLFNDYSNLNNMNMTLVKSLRMNDYSKELFLLSEEELNQKIDEILENNEN
jgi:hypothetical protein